MKPLNNPFQLGNTKGISHRWAFMVAVALILITGCGTTTTRLATEQLLMSDAVDQAISKIDFRTLRGKKVFLDTLYLHSVQGVGFVNSEYIISSLRQQLTAAQCYVQDSRETAEVIVEPRVGALGTDGHEVVYGIPQSGSIVTAAAAFSNAPIPAIPEIAIGKSNAQSGIAKVIVYAYNRESREPIWQSGIAKAESTSSNTWFMGAGPFQKGSIYKGMRFAGKKFPPPPHFEHGGLATHSEDGRIEKPVEVVRYEEEYWFEPGYSKKLIPPATPPEDVAESQDLNSQPSAVKQAVHVETKNVSPKSKP